MDINEFEARLSRIIDDTGLGAPGGAQPRQAVDVAARIEQFDTLEQELRDVIRRSDTPEKFRELLDMFLSLRVSLTGASIASLD